MKKILPVVFLFFLLSAGFVCAQHNEEKALQFGFMAIPANIDIGIAGLGIFAKKNNNPDRIFEPNIGPTGRFGIPILVTTKIRETTNRPITLIDIGLLAYLTVGLSDQGNIYLGGGPSLGILDGFFSITVGPSYVIGDNVDSFYWSFVITSNPWNIQ